MGQFQAGDYVTCEAFKGHVKGFVFKRDDLGLGYYRDTGCRFWSPRRLLRATSSRALSRAISSDPLAEGTAALTAPLRLRGVRSFWRALASPSSATGGRGELVPIFKNLPAVGAPLRSCTRARCSAASRLLTSRSLLTSVPLPSSHVPWVVRRKRVIALQNCVRLRGSPGRLGTTGITSASLAFGLIVRSASRWSFGSAGF